MEVKAGSPNEREENIERVRRGFLRLRGRIPGMSHLEVGVDSSRVDYACDVILITEFEAQAALDAYVSDPDHPRVRDELTGVRIERHQVDFAA